MSDPKFKNKFKARSFSKNSRVKTFNTRLPLTPHIFQIHYHYKQQIFFKEFLIVLNIYYLIV